MGTKYVTKVFPSLPCQTACGGVAVLCLCDPTLLTPQKRTISATYDTPTHLATGGWSYTFAYNDALLSNILRPLTSADITSAILDRCLIDYVNENALHIVSDSAGNIITLGTDGGAYLSLCDIGENLPIEAGVTEAYRDLADKSNYAVGLDEDGCLVRKLKVIVSAAIDGSSATTAFPADVGTIVDYNNEVIDPLSLVTDGAAWSAVIPATGNYRIQASFSGNFAAPASGNALTSYLSINVFVNGVIRRALHATSYRTQTGDAFFFFVQGSQVEALTAGQTIDIRVGPSGFPDALVLNANSSFTRFNLERIL